jgi:hypothetical protein
MGVFYEYDVQCLSTTVICTKTNGRRTFGPKKVEVMAGWRKLYDEELHNL